MTRFNGSLKSLRNFLRNDLGNVTMITGLAALPLFVAAGAGIDFARMTRESSAFKAAVDSAAIAVVSSTRSGLTGLSDTQKTARIAELSAYAKSYITTNYSGQFGAADSVTATVSITGQAVTLTASHSMPMSLWGLTGLSGSTQTVTTEVKKASRPVELVMVMDTTGSMGTTYMAQAKTAAQNLTTKLYGADAATASSDKNIRLALVPFSGAVRLDKSAYDFDSNWIDTTGAATVSKLNFSDTTWNNYKAWTQLSNTPWNGCVEARLAGTGTSDYNVNDTAPTTGDTLFTPYFAPDEPSFSTNDSTRGQSGFYNTYIANGGSPNEQTNLASTSTTSTNWLARQNNVSKYVNKSITAESSSDYGPWFNCAKSKVVPLTYDRAKIEAGITAMTASGSTVIAEGLAWGWRVLSPTAPFTKVEASASVAADTIAPYNDVKWRKVMVLMTDGENDVLSNGSEINTLNGTWYSSYGRGKATTGNRFGTTTSTSTSAALDTAMSTLCTRIKASGIEIYTVAFRVSTTSITNRLKACATDNAHYSYAADGVALGTIFNHIGENVTNAAIYLSK
jgi:Flp pilus assembly protein TadG